MGEKVSFSSNGGTSEGYLARPEQPNGAAAIVIQEWWGLVGHIEDVADRMAAEGFLALAPDLYHGVRTTEPDEAGKLLMGLAMDQAAKDIAGAAAYLVGQVGGGKVATVGFCMGGSLALWSATLANDVVVTAGFYPPLPWERMRPEWTNYAGKAAIIHCAEADGTSAVPGIQQAKQAIETAGGECVTYDYSGTEHAFFNDERPEVHHSEASTLAWERTLAFFRDRLR